MLCPSQKHERTKEKDAREALYLEIGQLKHSSRRWPLAGPAWPGFCTRCVTGMTTVDFSSGKESVPCSKMK